MHDTTHAHTLTHTQEHTQFVFYMDKYKTCLSVPANFVTSAPAKQMTCFVTSFQTIVPRGCTRNFSL